MSHSSKPTLNKENDLIINTEPFNKSLSKEMLKLDKTFYTQDFPEEWYISHCEKTNSIIYTLRDSDGKLQGYALLLGVDDRYTEATQTKTCDNVELFMNPTEGKYLYLANIIIAEKYRGLGYGSKLLLVITSLYKKYRKPILLEAINQDVVRIYLNHYFVPVRKITSSYGTNYIVMKFEDNF